jgi:hypothetical protein
LIFFFFSSLQRASTPFLTLFLSLNRTPPTTNSSKTHHSKVSFGKVLTPVGVALLTYGFGAFFGFGALSGLLADAAIGIRMVDCLRRPHNRLRHENSVRLLS